MFRRKKGRRDDKSETQKRPASSAADGAASNRACPSNNDQPDDNGGEGDSPRRRRHNQRSHGRTDDATATDDDLFSLVPRYLRPPVLHHYHGDFFATAQTDPSMFVQVMAEGFLPIASRYGNQTLVLPKLHEERCVICPITDMHTPRSVRKKAKRYELTLNRNFDGVVAGCHRQHGENWLYPEVVQSFRAIHSTGEAGAKAVLFDDSSAPARPVGSCPVRLYSVEVRNVESGALVAGELGYTVGNVYTSLTGFTAEDGAGSVQLAALGALLIKCGFDCWDMGMEMDYKGRLGARLMPRAEFVGMFRRGRVERPNVRLSCDGELGKNCKEIITGEDMSEGGGGAGAGDVRKKKSNRKAKGRKVPDTSKSKGGALVDGTGGNGQQADAKSESPKRLRRDVDEDVSGQGQNGFPARA